MRFRNFPISGYTFSTGFGIPESPSTFVEEVSANAESAKTFVEEVPANAESTDIQDLSMRISYLRLFCRKIKK